ncbi:complex I subunit 5 family protein [Pyrococcus abyssi]|nr:proton-conducting transporter membrane subunit [Pyrococcus abyssi]CCE70927.1 TPA: hydrogenase-4 component b [Pyrococcus abyssi GE5]
MELALPLVLFILGMLGGLSKKAFKVSSAFAALASLSIVALVFNLKPVEGKLLGLPVYIDGFSLIFMLILGILGFSASLYSIPYMERHPGKEWVYAVAYNAFLLSMFLILITSNLVWFVFFWELMTLSSFILITWDEKDFDPGIKYYIAMHILTTFPLFISLGVSYSFLGSLDAMTYPNLKSLPSSATLLLYASFLIAFMAKSGIVPFHFWVPSTYKVAPSNISSLLAGAMEKIAVFGLIRIMYTALPTPKSIGYLVALLGAVTLTVGTLYALRESDAKKLLAYHSIGQMGYIWLGIGIGLSLDSPLGALGMFAGIFHALNHSLFKGSLFLSAGSVEYATGETNLDNLGGLAERMKWTGLATLLASLAISGVPPFNGFLSKWLIYTAGYNSGDMVLSFGAVLAVFISAVTLASFIKFYTSQFGGESERYRDVSEVPLSMVVPQLILSSLCLIIGIFPALVVPLINEPIGAPISTSLYLNFDSTAFSPLIFGLLIVTLAFGTYIGLEPRGEEAEPWDCGASFIERDEYRVRAHHYYLKYEEKVGNFYAFGDWAYSVGASLVNAIVRFYVWIAKYFVKIVDTPYTKVRGVSDLRKHKVMYIDEELFLPFIRFLMVARNVLKCPSFDTLMTISLVLLLILLIFAGWGI